MKNFLYKLTLRLYLFSIAFYFIFSTISPKFLLRKNSESLFKFRLDNSVHYYSALTSTEVKALTKKIFLDMKYKNVFSQPISFKIMVTKEGKLLGNSSSLNLSESVKYWDTLRMKKQMIPFDIFKIIFT
jgi:hypothetical protein